MNPLIGMLANQLGGPVIQQIGHRIGADQGTTQSAVGVALPMLLGAICNHANTPAGANDIQSAAQQHDGSILDDVIGFVSNAGAAGTSGALVNQVLDGGTHHAIVDAIASHTGLDSGAAMQLLAILTPLVMGAIGKYSQEQGGLDVNNISQLLSANSGGNDLLGKAMQAIDTNGDGNVMDDVGNIVGKLFN